MTTPLMTKETCAHILREFAAMVEHSEGDVKFNLHCERFRVVTAERLKEADEALRDGYRLSLFDPITIDINYDSAAIGGRTSGVGWPD